MRNCGTSVLTPLVLTPSGSCQSWSLRLRKLAVPRCTRCRGSPGAAAAAAARAGGVPAGAQGFLLCLDAIRDGSACLSYILPIGVVVTRRTGGICSPHGT